MDCGSQVNWNEGTRQSDIDALKKACVLRLGVEIAPHLMHGPVRIRVSEEITHTDDFGIPRVVYTLRARIEPA